MEHVDDITPHVLKAQFNRSKLSMLSIALMERSF